ncbi:FAD/NAD(P)-binding domain-containing protein [Colletotrichum sublineola]|nr:FAD/NAD(P)-binding domain-containing protein [Colletotrichum sublineola]
MTYRLLSGELYVGLNPPTGAEPLGTLYPRAGTLGGCGSHNVLITVYPDRSDWDGIAALTGDSSWNAINMRKYFRRLENCQYLPNDTVGHGFSGWLTTNRTDLGLVLRDVKLLTVIFSAVSAMDKSFSGWFMSTTRGFGQIVLSNIDVDLPDRDAAEGLYQVPIAADRGTRVSPRDFILATATAKGADGSRKYHLDLKLNTLVTKVRFDQSGPKPRAVGVDFITGQSLYRADPRSGSSGEGAARSVNATAEVIVSAVIVDLPGVGTNLQDRYETSRTCKSSCADNELLPEFVKNEAWGHHASCTCPIGKDGDAMAVLDSKFRVRGTEGLRVADASVFPKIPGFYIAVPLYMASEKAADVILGV